MHSARQTITLTRISLHQTTLLNQQSGRTLCIEFLKVVFLKKTYYILFIEAEKERKVLIVTVKKFGQRETLQ